MKLPQRLLGGFVAVTAFALGALLPAHADTVLAGSAQVTNPTGDVAGQWVTPTGTTNPPVSPGANINFTSKHSISSTGSVPGSTVVANFSIDLEFGTRNADGSFNFQSTLDVKSYYAEGTADTVGNWNPSAYTNIQLSKTKYVAGQPSAPNIPAYVALAETYNANGYAQLSSDHKDFKVSMPSGSPNP